MNDLIVALQSTPAPTLLIVGGMAMLILGLAGGISGKIEVPEKRQKPTGILGVVFVILGVILFIIPNSGKAVTPVEEVSPVAFTDTPELEEEATATFTDTPEMVEEQVKDTPTEEPAAIKEDIPGELVEAQNWTLLFSDPFDVDNDIWDVGEYNSDSQVEFSIMDGVYRWDFTILDGGEVFHWTSPDIPTAQNFYLKVSTRLVQGRAADARYGLLFRQQNYSYYVFRIEEGSNYRVRLNQDDTWKDLTGLIFIPDFSPGEWITLEIIAIDSEFSFYVDGNFVGVSTDTTLGFGDVGLVVYSDNPGKRLVIDFDDFELRKQP